jgi:hypothetical protein
MHVNPTFSGTAQSEATQDDVPGQHVGDFVVQEAYDSGQATIIAVEDEDENGDQTPE